MTRASDVTGPGGPLAAEIARLRKRLLAAHKAKRAAVAEADRLRAELAARPPAEPDHYAGWTEEEIRELWDRFRKERCETCKGLHTKACGRVKDVEYMKQGDLVLIRRVRFHKKWDDSDVLYAEDLPPLPGETA